LPIASSILPSIFWAAALALSCKLIILISFIFSFPNSRLQSHE